MKKSLVFSGMGALAALTGCSSPETQKPNIVFFFADDIGTECFGCYGDEHPVKAAKAPIPEKTNDFFMIRIC